MRFVILLSVSLATTSLCIGAGFSRVHHLPPLKMGATDLDAILLKAHSLVDRANGPDELGRESVKIDIHSQDIEIPHLSLASRGGFPVGFSAFFSLSRQADKPISSVTIDLGDSVR